ncbi:MAG: nitrogenase molybdenum-iron protein [Pseudobutyrivibrio sp.]|nr:nitrogenase molybdenum-iron protein [Pseudobutyrivibrio sp.]
MSNVIKNPRNGCALHGALQTIKEINGVVPVVHANAGCGVVNYLSRNRTSGGESRYSGFSIPGTAAQERHVIFGGASRLREQIKNTIKVINGDLYVILNSCESAMVGDDVDAMTREIVEQGEPVVDTLVAGFNGGIHYGYEHVLADIFKTIDAVKVSEKITNPSLVNILGIVPNHDPYWQGNLDEITRILEGLGLEVNSFFGADSNVDALVNAKNASLTIVFSKWGELPAKVLEEKHGIPVIYRESLPISSEDVKALVDSLASYISLDNEKSQSFIEREKRYEDNVLYRVRDEIIEKGISKNAVIVGDEEQVIRIGRFLKDKLGVEITASILADSLKKDDEHIINNDELLSEISKNTYKTVDQKEIDDIIRAGNAEVVFGSSLERNIANKLNIPLVEISYPIFDELILEETTIGVKGEIQIIERYLSSIRLFEKAKNNELLQLVKGNSNIDSWRDRGDNKVRFSKGLHVRKQEFNVSNG